MPVLAVITATLQTVFVGQKGHFMGIGGPRAWRRGDDGAAAVEFAIVVPVLLLLLLGILEFAFVMRDSLSVSSAVRVGTRTAASGLGSGMCTVAACGAGVPARVPLLAQASADAIQRAGTAMNQDLIDNIWIYEANTYGYTSLWNNGDGSAAPTLVSEYTSKDQMLAAGCTASTHCIEYRWVDAQNRFRYVAGGWDVKWVNGCITRTPGVGVYMKAQHPYITRLFGATLTLDDRSVMVFEPLPSNICLPGQHDL